MQRRIHKRNKRARTFNSKYSYFNIIIKFIKNLESICGKAKLSGRSITFTITFWFLLIKHKEDIL